MAKVLIIIIASIILVLSFLFFYKIQYDAHAEKIILQTIKFLDKYHQSTDKYPLSLAEVPVFNGTKENILVVLPPPKINYRLFEGNCRIDYYKFPFGPFKGYDFKTKEWYCEE